MRVERNASETISATWVSNGRTRERGWNTNGIGIQRVRVSSTECPDATRGTPENDLYAPCTDLRYCFPAARDTRIAKTVYQHVDGTNDYADSTLDREKERETTPMRSPMLRCIRVPGADPRETIAHCNALVYGTVGRCALGTRGVGMLFEIYGCRFFLLCSLGW